MSKYYKKYVEYKYKYLLLKEHGDEYDIPDIDYDIPSNDTPDTDSMISDIEDDNTDELIEAAIESDELSKKDVSIGMFGKAVGKIFDYSHFDQSEFTTINSNAHGKILQISTTDDFDTFTNKYAHIRKKTLYIKWNLVAQDYRGIYLSPAIPNRDEMAPYHGKTFNTWIGNDYDIKGVAIFLHIDKVTKGKRITKPFRGKMIDSYAVNENEYTNINEKKIGKILLIDDIKSFDLFTNKYGMIKKHKLVIDWKKVHLRYKGIYLDKSIKKYRKYEAFYKNRKQESWWNKNMVDSFVYLFA